MLDRLGSRHELDVELIPLDSVRRRTFDEKHVRILMDQAAKGCKLRVRQVAIAILPLTVKRCCHCISVLSRGEVDILVVFLEVGRCFRAIHGQSPQAQALHGQAEPHSAVPRQTASNAKAVFHGPGPEW